MDSRSKPNSSRRFRGTLKHLGRHRHAESSFHPTDAGERHLGFLRSVGRFALVQTAAAFAAWPHIRFAEVIDDILLQATLRPAVIHHRDAAWTSESTCDPAPRSLLDEKSLHLHVRRLEQQHAFALLAVPASPPLPVIRFQIAGHLPVHDITDIRLVDAHAERIRRNHHPVLVEPERLLRLRALRSSRPP